MIDRNKYSLEHIQFEGKLSKRGHDPQKTASIAQRRFVHPIHLASDSAPLNEFAAWVLESCGLPAKAYRPAPLHRRLAACMRGLKADSLAHAHHLLKKHPALRAAAIDSFLIGVTEFSRDTAVFETLRRVIPGDSALHKDPIRVWSAGCSNGAELYSVAMLLAEEGLLSRSILLGTDCRAGAIREAQCGLYPEAYVLPMDASLRRKYMHRIGGQWRVRQSLHAPIQWRVQNLLAGCEKGPWDIILWRNMAIYLKPESAEQVWEAMMRELRTGGILVAGRAERPPASAGLACIGPCVYRLQRPAAGEPGRFDRVEKRG